MTCVGMEGPGWGGVATAGRTGRREVGIGIEKSWPGEG